MVQLGFNDDENLKLLSYVQVCVYVNSASEREKVREASEIDRVFLK